jgi:hypothetical protein
MAERKPDSHSVGALKRVLADLSSVEREALHRFYVLEQDTKQILRDLSLSQHQWREIKSRVKKAFAAIINKPQ